MVPIDLLDTELLQTFSLLLKKNAPSAKHSKTKCAKCGMRVLNQPVLGQNEAIEDFEGLRV